MLWVCPAARPKLANRDFFISGESYAVSARHTVIGSGLAGRKALYWAWTVVFSSLSPVSGSLLHDTVTPGQHALCRSWSCSHTLACAAWCCTQGHYAPAVAHRVYKASELGQGPPINLKGVAIGNGMTNPSVQFPAYADFALQNNLISQGVSGLGTVLCCSPACDFWQTSAAHRSCLSAAAECLARRQAVRVPRGCTSYQNMHMSVCCCLQTHDSIQWWGGLCRWGANFCSKHKWAWFCGLTLQYCQVSQPVLLARIAAEVRLVHDRLSGHSSCGFVKIEALCHHWCSANHNNTCNAC